MSLVWNLYGALAFLASGVAWAAAAFVFLARPERVQNRRLSLLLVLEGIILCFGNGIQMSSTDAAAVYAADVVYLMGAFGLLAAYLSFVGTLSTPFAAPFKSRIGLLLVGLIAAAFVGSAFVAREWYIASVIPAPYATWDNLWGPGFHAVFAISAAISFFALVAAADAWRRAPPGAPSRDRARMIALAFGTRDSLYVVILLSLVLRPGVGGIWTDFAYIGWPMTVIAYTALLAYGILRHQLFDIDLKLKWGIRRGTLVGVFVAAFFVVAAIAEQYLQRFGVLAGGVAVGLLLFALRPIERAADRLANVAMPRVQDNDEYRLVRKREVYRAAIEGALQDGAVTPRERAILARLQDELGLTATEAHLIESEATTAMPA